MLYFNAIRGVARRTYYVRHARQLRMASRRPPSFPNKSTALFLA
jgi:hypothetical protein